MSEGETLGLVGESGCGKSTLGRTIVRLLEPTEGNVIFEGRDISKLGTRALRPLRREMQMIFQDPYASLNPRKRVGSIIGTPLKIHGVEKSQRRARVQELLETVGLSPEHYNRFPHEFSGGQRQRIGVARALALNPKLVVADEPVSALDVSIQSQMLNLLDDLQKELSADLHLHRPRPRGRSARERPDRRDVPGQARRALAGRGSLPAADHALHRGAPLRGADPRSGSERMQRERIVLQGDVPSPINPPSGCRFHPRCRYMTDICKEVEPPLVDYGRGHLAACHHPLNVDRETLERVEVSSRHTPAAADDAAKPRDSSGRSDPVPGR